MVYKMKIEITKKKGKKIRDSISKKKYIKKEKWDIGWWKEIFKRREKKMTITHKNKAIITIKWTFFIRQNGSNSS